MTCQALRRRIAHRKDVHHEVLEELASECLLIDGGGRLARRDNFVQMKKAGDQMLASVPKESALEPGFRADEKCRALGSEEKTPFASFARKLEHQSAHHGRQSALGSARLFVNLRNRLRTAVQNVKNAVSNGCLQKQRRTYPHANCMMRSGVTEAVPELVIILLVLFAECKTPTAPL